MLVGIGAVLVAAARLAAHVQHVQDVVAGPLIGLAAGIIGILVTRLMVSRLHGRSRVGHGSTRVARPDA